MRGSGRRPAISAAHPRENECGGDQNFLQSARPQYLRPYALGTVSLSGHLSETHPILVVEDDPDSRTMLATMLEWQGYQVVTASNGMEAFNMANRHHPWLIILDLMMPVMSGEEFRRVQLASSTLKNIPVLVLSAHHDAPQIARRLHVEGCLRKPIDFAALEDFIAKRR
jgi:CheY-like chemotaxis protein